MPITSTKIWMNGELVDWADATVHVGVHGLHYGTGVFEGIRCYETPKVLPSSGSPTTCSACHDSARLLYMEIPYTVEELTGDPRAPRPNGLARVLHPSDRVLRLRRDGAQHAAVLGRRVDCLLAVGCVFSATTPSRACG